MHLKSLTLRGFKSFASTTMLQFEPGITCVVGPNGTGKSNVVDALSWVMGEQGAKSLRGGKMEDVIFAGTVNKAPLGRAEVVLTIDNTDGALPIEYAEVTISRTMFRNGGSEYAINNNPCRLLDVQELLSDSGIGREMHVIVGQGQLDSILGATPDDRRGFIEEAAGVLKHRKRKEKALRKLESTEQNLTRLQDLLTELRRQLKPLGKQAETARHAVAIQAEVRDARARLLADDLHQAQNILQSELAGQREQREQREAAEADIARLRGQETELEEALAADAPALSTAQDTWYRLTSMAERIRGTCALAHERIRQNSQDEDEQETSHDPDELEAEADRIGNEHRELMTSVQEAQYALDAAIERKNEAEANYAAEERRVADAARAASDNREGLERLRGQVNALDSRAAASKEEITRLQSAREHALERASEYDREFTALQTTIGGLYDGEGGLDAAHDEACSALEEVDAKLEEARDQLQDAERQHAALTARLEALRVGLDRQDGASALLAEGTDRVSGIVGSIASMVTVTTGFEAAVAAALGDLAEAVVVANTATALDAITVLRDDELGRSGLVVTDTAEVPDSWPELPAGACYLTEVISVPNSMQHTLRRILHKAAVVDDLAAARRLVDAVDGVVAVTRNGDILGSYFARGGSAEQSELETRAALEETEQDVSRVTAWIDQGRGQLEQLQEQRAQASAQVESTLAQLHESDARMAAVAEKLDSYGSSAQSARAEAQRLADAVADAEQARDRDLAGLEELQHRLETAENHEVAEPDTGELERLAGLAAQARQAETQERLTLRTHEERAKALAGRADSLRESAATQRAARQRAEERRQHRQRQADAGRRAAEAGETALHHLESSVAAAAKERARIEESRSGRQERQRAVRDELRERTEELERLTDSAHREEMARAEQRMKVENLEQRAIDELGLEPESLLADYGPDQPIPTEEADDEDPTVPFVREEQEKRLRKAEQRLAQLGKVNPLALEEYQAMEERHQFLSEQLEDVRSTRQGLFDIVGDVDAQVQKVFTEAWQDVSEVFEDIFSRLFPGGEGRLVLTDPDDMLTTGIDVEARPAGKKVKRLSLLSGGERSLVAVAFLVSLFKARPSPFYILDEVEAALDDANLGRVLRIYEELRESSQLIVITHQKRTMEVADALYGVSMRGDGVSTVISQRLRDEESA